jgi:hypothetical protein
MSYWKYVPKGTWKVTDPVDALNALRDQESCYTFDKIHNRVNVFGPPGKAIFIDLSEIDYNDEHGQELEDFVSLLIEPR